MRDEVVHPLDSETLAMFASKGQQGGGGVEQTGDTNAVKVRRIIQILRDLASPAGDTLRVLDLGCGEGVYSIEAALRGFEVLAMDARTERMADGTRAAARIGLTNIRFEQRDIRAVTRASHGEFDVIFLLGILYHLDVPDVFHVLENIHQMCRQMVVIDTHVALNPRSSAEHNGRVYTGRMYREHDDDDPDPVRRSRLLASIDNPSSFWFTRKSLIDLLCAIGFSSVFECHAPREALKPEDRITLAAMKGTRVQVSTYPWVNSKTEDEVEGTLRKLVQRRTSRTRDGHGSVKRRIGSVVNRMLRPLGCQIVSV